MIERIASHVRDNARTIILCLAFAVCAWACIDVAMHAREDDMAKFRKQHPEVVFIGGDDPYEFRDVTVNGRRYVIVTHNGHFQVVPIADKEK